LPAASRPPGKHVERRRCGGGEAMQKTADDRAEAAVVFLGVDTHLDAHVGVALDGVGRRLGELAVPNNEAGYAQLLGWLLGFGALAAVGVEGTGSYGAGLSRFLKAKGVSVREVNRMSRQHRRRHGKHDAGDAYAAARAVLAGEASGEPKGADGAAESLRALRVARRSAVKARTQAANQLHALVSTAPERLKASLRGFATKQLAQKASRFRYSAESADPTAATKFALRSVARRYEVLSAEITELDAHIERLAREAAPELIALDGVGPDTAATLLAAAGDNPERLKSEASFAHLCGAAPVAASSGKTLRHRLNPGGNRDANRALHVVALNRLRRDPRTRQYVARRTAEGKSKKEAMRCLKCYIARETYRAILLDTGACVPPG
jgi:transposase